MIIHIEIDIHPVIKKIPNQIGDVPKFVIHRRYDSVPALPGSFFHICPVGPRQSPSGSMHVMNSRQRSEDKK